MYPWFSHNFGSYGTFSSEAWGVVNIGGGRKGLHLHQTFVVHCLCHRLRWFRCNGQTKWVSMSMSLFISLVLQPQYRVFIFGLSLPMFLSIFYVYVFVSLSVSVSVLLLYLFLCRSYFECRRIFYFCRVLSYYGPFVDI